MSDFIGQFESPYAQSASSSACATRANSGDAAPSTPTNHASTKDKIVDLIDDSPQVLAAAKKPSDESGTHLKFTPSTLIAKYLSVDAQSITSSGDSKLRENLLNGVKDFITKKFDRKSEKGSTELTDLTDESHTYFQRNVLALPGSNNELTKVPVTLLSSMNVNQSLKRISLSFPVDTPLVFIALVISLHLEDQQYMNRPFDVYTTHPRKGFCEWLRESNGSNGTTSSIYSFGTTLATVGITCNTKVVVEFTS